MENLLIKIGSAIASVGLFLGSLFGFTPETASEVPMTVLPPQEEVQTLGGTLPIAGHTYTLSGSGITSSQTTITLQSFTLPQTSQPIIDSDLSSTFYLTLEPGNRTRQEIVSCTTVTQNAGGTATLSGCSRGLSPITPFTASSTLRFSHGGGSQVIFSDPPQLFNSYAAKDNAESISGQWVYSTVPQATSDPTAGNDLVRRSWVLSNLPAGAVGVDSVKVSAVAGETFATGTIVYFDRTQTEWMKTDADATGTAYNITIGIAQGAGANGVAISNGVLIHGVDATQGTTLTPGQRLYLSNTAGATSTTAGTFTRQIGIVKDANEFYLDYTGINEDAFFSTATSTRFVALHGTTTNATTTNLAINGLSYRWPAGYVASSTVLTSDGAGGLIWTQPLKLVADGTLKSSTLNASTTVYTYTIPAGFLGVTEGLKIEALAAVNGGSGDLYGWDIQFGNGSASTTLFSVFNNEGGIVNIPMQVWLYNNNSASAQNSGAYAPNGSSTWGLTVTASSTATTVNTAAQSYISFRTKNIANSGISVSFRGINITKLAD